jgi:hypothetical protein
VHLYLTRLINNNYNFQYCGGADYVRFVRYDVNDSRRCSSFNSLACKGKFHA